LELKAEFKNSDCGKISLTKKTNWTLKWRIESHNGTKNRNGKGNSKCRNEHTNGMKKTETKTNLCGKISLTEKTTLNIENGKQNSDY